MKYNARFCSWLCIFAEVVRVLNNSNVSSHILFFTKLNQITQFYTNCSKPSILKVIPTNNNLSDISFVKCKNQNETHLALRTFIQTICITLSIFSEGKLPPGKCLTLDWQVSPCHRWLWSADSKTQQGHAAPLIHGDIWGDVHDLGRDWKETEEKRHVWEGFFAEKEASASHAFK